MVSARDGDVQEANDHASCATTEKALLEGNLKLAMKKLLKVEANANSYRAVSEDRQREIDEMRPKLNHLKDVKVNYSELYIIEEKGKRIEEQERRIEELSANLASTQEDLLTTYSNLATLHIQLEGEKRKKEKQKKGYRKGDSFRKK